MFKFKRAILAVLTAVSLLIPLSAHAWRLEPERLQMRNTSGGGTVARDLNWAKGIPGSPGTLAFVDSMTFSHGSATGNGKIADTTAAYRIGDWMFPPTFPYRAAGQMSRAQKSFGNTQPTTAGASGSVDSVVVDTTDATPWIIIRVRQDSLSYNTPSATQVACSIDSVGLAAEWSPNGVDWYAVSGTPTRAFSAVAVTSGADGTQPPLLQATEALNSLDAVVFPIQCQPNVATGSSYIINRSLCACEGFVRFLVTISDDGYGQYEVELQHWVDVVTNGHGVQ